ncbi:MAG TPA: hypothetical protein VFI47_15420 [Acidimicrobiales bacterium]|nr:hypothetical protein [Acidimicrobiales bacterium]
MSKKTRCLAVILLTAATFASACAGNRGEDADEGTSAVVATGLAAWPSSSFDDWASYGDAVVILQIESERAEPMSDDEVQRGEGLGLRTVSGTVTQLVWTYPGGPAPPTTSFEFLTAGWIVREGRSSPMRYAGAIRLEVGSSYLMPIFQDRTTGSWAPLSSTAAFPVDDESAIEQVATTAEEGAGPEVAMTPSGVAAAMQAASPAPAAAANRQLAPRDRYLAVVAEQTTADNG